MTETPKNILLHAVNGRHGSAAAAAAIYPGSALLVLADDTVAVPSVAKAEMAKRCWAILVEDRLQGKTIDEPCVIDETVKHYTPLPGDVVQVLVKSGQTIVADDNGVIEGGGSGLFVKAAGTEAKYHVQFLEASGGALAANTLLRARVS